MAVQALLNSPDADLLGRVAAGEVATLAWAGATAAPGASEPVQASDGALTGTVVIRWEGSGRPLITSVPAPGMSEDDARSELARRFLHVVLLNAIRDKATQLEVRFGEDGGLLYYRIEGRDWELAPPPDEVYLLLKDTVREASRLVQPERPELTVIAGVPGAVVLGFLVLLLAISQIGAILLPVVWGGAGWWLFQREETGWGVFMLVWGFLLVTMSDNVLRPWLISRGLTMPMTLVILGVFGGFISFGL